jgi:FtsP/CotA-like multicopper oxidase with cupredoxin domain
MKNFIGRLLLGAVVVSTSLMGPVANAAVPGITGWSGTSTTTAGFYLNAMDGYTSQPDGASIYTWGYGCTNASAPGYLPNSIGTKQGANCPAMQLPGPTMIVNQGDTVTVTLTNNLPVAAGTTSILFPGFDVKSTNGVPGVLTQEAPNASCGSAGCNTVTYTFVATTPGTHSYYSGTQGDLQVELGLYGAIVVLPTLGGAVPAGYVSPTLATIKAPDTCVEVGHKPGRAADDPDFRLSSAAYNNPATCYDREYLFQFAEMDPRIHNQAQAQAGLPCINATGCMLVETEPYRSAYFLINGRSMPDDMDPNYAAQYPNQPYNGNPHMHPGELTLVRIIGQGRMQHPFHEHGNHLRLIARDGNLLQTAKGSMAGPLLFTTTTTPGMTLDAIYQWTAKGLNWDVYGHHDRDANNAATVDDCQSDANGYYTANPAAPNYYEWCADHKKPLESKPFGNVGSNGPVTLPDPNIVVNGAWYGGSPYLGPEATGRAVGSTPIPPSGTVANSPTDEAGFGFMWHSHNEREITTNNIFPGGMMMLMLVDPWTYSINESN